MIELAVKELLAGDEAVTALVATRIRPLIGAQLDTYPCLVYQVSGGKGLGTHSGPSVHRKATVEVTSYADTYAGCVTLAGHVRRVLDHYVGIVGGVKITPSLLDDDGESDIEQAVEPGTERIVFVRTQTFRVLYRPA